MKTKCTFFLTATLGVSLAQAASPSLEDDSAKASYNIGLYVGENIKLRVFDEYDIDALLLGIEDSLTNQTPRISDAESRDAIEAMGSREADEQLAQSTHFLQENSSRDGVEITDSGLQYEVLVAGNGLTPTLSDTVEVNYVGTFIDGTVFDDSSAHSQEPAQLQLNSVIPGWTEVLQIMEVGSTYKIILPPTLAYGTTGAPGIPPNAALVFEIELVNILS